MIGDFDPLTQEDVNRMKIAKSKGDWLIVGVNSDSRVAAKNGACHFPYEFRHMIVQNAKYVDEVFKYESDSPDSRLLLLTIKQCYPGASYHYFSSDKSANTETQIRGITITKF